jgi:predicted DsbA family dithiol-disulfide isomerase
VRRFVKTGRLRLDLRGLHFVGPDSEKALRAILAAAQQDKAWNMLEELYARQGGENSGWVTDDVLRDAATAAGVDVAKMKAAADSPRVTSQIVESDATATTLGVPGTPSFALVRPPEGPRLLTIPSLEPADFAATLESELGT